ncbi:hypothetical protein FRC02_003467 [Tulasnella sp. 418]|nr:hypothetical protein FRC02_003467 [Tulasnella sp. 418]
MNNTQGQFVHINMSSRITVFLFIQVDPRITNLHHTCPIMVPRSSRLPQAVNERPGSLNTQNSHATTRQSTRIQRTLSRQSSDSVYENHHRFGPEAQSLEARLLAHDTPAVSVQLPQNGFVHPASPFLEMWMQRNAPNDGITRSLRRACHRMLIRGGRHMNTLAAYTCKRSCHHQKSSQKEPRSSLPSAPLERSFTARIL